MRIAILADIHSNLDALDAILRHAEALGPIGRVWCLGDTVGYAAEPSACIARLRQYDHIAVAGNHDLAALERMGVDEFNPAAAAAALWTRGQLSAEERAYLESLPLVITEGDFTLVHGSLRWPELEYLLSSEAAAEQFRRQETPFSLVGHSHIPFVAVEVPSGSPLLAPLSDGDVVELEDRRLIVNPGGVGQPRDGDPRASYAIHDTEARTIALHRVEYDIASAQGKIRKAGLPAYLAERLAHGH